MIDYIAPDQCPKCFAYNADRDGHVYPCVTDDGDDN